MIRVKAREENQLGVFTQCDFRAGQTVQSIEVSDTLSLPDRYSIQIGPNCHFDPKDTLFGKLNHSCSPNSEIHWSEPTLSIRALRDIDRGEEVTFNYLTTESHLAEPFQCHCGSSNCYGQIRGFSFLPKESGGQ